jgi:hypothetical protein
VKRALCALVIAFAVPAAAQTPAIGITQVTVTWSAPTAYEPEIGAVTDLTVTTAPAGTLTDGTYPLYLSQGSDEGACCLEASLTVTGGTLTAAAVVYGGYGYSPGDTLTVPASFLPGATSGATLMVTGTATLPAIALQASDIDHYTIWWGPSDGPGHCQAANCIRGPYGAVEVPAGTTTYTIAAACGDLEVELAVATGSAAQLPYSVSDHATVMIATGLTCPLPGSPGAPKLSWPKA